MWKARRQHSRLPPQHGRIFILAHTCTDAAGASWLSAPSPVLVPAWVSFHQKLGN